MAQVTIRRGEYRNFKVANKTLRLVQGYTEGAKGGFVKVRNDGMFPGCPDEVKIKVPAGILKYRVLKISRGV